MDPELNAIKIEMNEAQVEFNSYFVANNNPLEPKSEDTTIVLDETIPKISDDHEENKYENVLYMTCCNFKQDRNTVDSESRVILNMDPELNAIKIEMNEAQVEFNSYFVANNNPLEPKSEDTTIVLDETIPKISDDHEENKYENVLYMSCCNFKQDRNTVDSESRNFQSRSVPNTVHGPSDDDDNSCENSMDSSIDNISKAKFDKEQCSCFKNCTETLSKKKCGHNHMKIHKKETFKCSICLTNFSERSNLSRHLSTHTGRKEFECMKCGKKFTRKDIMTEHEQTHSKTKTMSCNKCSKMFSHKRGLLRHQSVHGEKFRCELCYKVFSQKSFLRTHIARAHPKNGSEVIEKKIFPCEKCYKTYAFKHGLKRHQKIHSENSTASFHPQ